MAPPTIPQSAGTSLLQCAVLGQSSVSVGDVRLAAEGELAFGLALYCALNAGTELARDAVAQLLWPTHDAEAARHCLRQLVYRLRALGVPLAANGDSLAIAPEHVVLDAGVLFTPEPSRAAYLTIERFDVLADYAPAFSTPFARWVEEMREQLGIRLRDGLMACIADARSRGRYREVSQLATHCLTLDPLNEEATLGLAEATALAGNKVRALQMLDAYRVDLGASPTLSLQTDLLRRRIAERLNVYGAQPDDVPMVGRDDAVEFLLRGLHAISGGKAHHLLIVGEPGVGKTRLLAEFQKIVAVHGVRTVALRCHPGWDEQPLTAITELARSMMQLPGALGCSPDALIALRELTGVVPRRSDAALYASDADAMLANLRWAVLDLFEAVMQERRLVLLVDNVQWLDALSESFLSYVLAQCAATPLYAVMTVRDEDARATDPSQRPLLATERRLALQPLDDASSRTLVHEVLEATDRSLPEAAIDDCVRRCGGNPYFLSELTRFFIVAGPGASAPVTLRTFIEFRLTKVSQAARRALQAVAILGAFSTIGRVRRVLQVSGYSILNALEELQLTGLVQLENERCECRHDVVREIAEAGMSGVARRVLHLRAARELRREAGAAKDAALLLECGRHLLRSGDTVRAPRGAVIVATRLLELGAAEGAEELSRVAARQTSEPRDRRGALLLRSRALRVLGRWKDLAAMVDVVADLNDPNQAQPLTEVRIHAAEAILHLGLNSEGTLESLVQIAHDETQRWERRLLAARLALIAADNYWNFGLAERVAPVVLAAPAKPLTVQVLATVSRVIMSTMLRQPDARSLAEQLLELRRGMRSTAMQLHCSKIAAHCLYRLGYLNRARELFRESLERSRNWGRFYYAFYDHLFLAVVELQTGNIDKSLHHLSDARNVGVKVEVVCDLMIMLDVLQLEADVENGNVPHLTQAEYRRLRQHSLSVDPRWYQAVLALRLVQASERRQIKTVHALREELRAALEKFSGAGWQDFPTFALANSYLSLGDAVESKRIVDGYLHSIRPERSELRPRLRSLAHQLGVTPRGTLSD